MYNGLRKGGEAVRTEIQRFLEENRDREYGAFHKKLCPDTRYEILGVRMPALRKFARKLAQMPPGETSAAPECYEEVMLLGLAAAYENRPLADRLARLREILPLFDCWAFTDCVAATFQPRPEELPLLWEFSLDCLKSQRPYIRRFGLVMMLDHLLVPDYLQPAAQAAAGVRDDHYYVRMAQAWLLAEVGTKAFELTVQILQEGKLDIFTHNKTVSKLRDSYRISPEQKKILKTLRRKEEKE